MIYSPNLQQKLANRRSWNWRGWNTCYAVVEASSEEPQTPLLFLHGFGGSIEHWQYNITALGKNRQAYALDLLGFGESEKPPENYTMTLWIEQVYDFWQRFIDRPVVLVGNSMGSALSLVAAQTHPSMVRGIALVGLPDLALLNWARPQWMQSVTSTMEEQLLLPLVQQTLAVLLRQPSVVRQWAKYLCVNWAPFTEELALSITKPTQTPEFEKAWSSIFLAMTRPNFMPKLEELLPKIEMPILWLEGEQDSVFPPNIDDRIFRACPNITRILLANAGHYLHYERSREVNRTIENWLESWDKNSSSLSESVLKAA
ncbi:alpha/beta fold hydrolase [Oscillatoriales cyanobacterium LEGE 11467]|uniref:Alpha/beta fold hydrolase n=1 Tax=Zarconia navalis LEGE 11467 TaxID=1828826 RepID=A0A928VW89_9CYAN|nr:alpha/beta fold hydrolase [Zarconia navalis]MBE9041301.1 alpha/beta fold hydrolase [Zarconia navalis LEGE 11467]